jgi:hypothetical protein
MKKLIIILGILLFIATAFPENVKVTNDATQPVPVRMSAGLSGATAKNACSGNVANATATATLASVTGKTNYITGLQVTATGATGALVVNVTVTGVVGGPLTYTFSFPAGATVSATPLTVVFNPPLPASGTGVAIVVSLPASGTGGTNASVCVQGYTTL